MSLIAMQGGATGTGTVTLLAPVTNTNRTLTLPDATGTVTYATGAGIVFPDATVQATAATAAALVTTTNVLNATAGASAGGVGTYAFLRHTTSADYAFGATLAGSNLQPAGIATNTFSLYTASGGSSSIAAVNQATAQSGTWQCMGVGSNITISCTAGTTASLWLRIS